MHHSLRTLLRISGVSLVVAALVHAPLRAAEPEVPYAIVDTAQTQCFNDEWPKACPNPYEDYYGQDGNYMGNGPQYRDNGDGTISDLVTGLMWQKDFDRGSFFEAPEKARSATTGGYADWRVPTTKELYSLIRFDGATGSGDPSSSSRPSDAIPYIDHRTFNFEYGRGQRYIDAQYVTSTAYSHFVMGRDRAFFGVNFADGRIKGYPQSGGPGQKQWYLRLVRGNPAYGKNDFADLGDGTIKDRATGLLWTKADSGGTVFQSAVSRTEKRDGRLDWREALAFCETLEFAGRSDWRLPNAKELHSLVDYMRAPDTTNSPAIDPAFDATPIKDPEGKRDYPFFWTSTSHLDGRRPGDHAIYIAFGRAQGYMGRPGGMGGPPPPGMGMRMGHPPPMGGPPGMGGPMGMGGDSGEKRLLDVHGAGAQRSSPKSGDESRLPKGFGPQGDILRIYNFARCVAGGLSKP